MSHSDSQQRYPFPSRFNDVHIRNERQYPYVDEEYVSPQSMRLADPDTRSRHMRAFEEALMADDRSIIDYAASSPSLPGSPIMHQPPGTARIRKVSAMSDFAPVNIKVKKSVSHYLKIALLLTVHHKLDGREGQVHQPGNKSGHLSFSGGHCWSVHVRPVRPYIWIR
jgi:hypothetical protein